MEEVKREYVFQISELGGLEVRVLLVMTAQEGPWSGDGVIVDARIELPAEKTGELIYDFGFGERLWIAGEPLRKHWGRPGDGCRWSCWCFNSTKASEAFSKAEKWALGEVQKLREAIKKRREARES